MPDLLKAAPYWFLIFLVLAFGGWFLWSAKTFFRKADELFTELLRSRDGHENRITKVETRLDSHLEEHHGGRRFYDPEDRKIN